MIQCCTKLVCFPILHIVTLVYYLLEGLQPTFTVKPTFIIEPIFIVDPNI